MNSRLASIVASAALLAACAGGNSKAPAAPAADSRDILARAQATNRAEVLHVLIGWAELEPAYRGPMDKRAKSRTKAQADALAGEILARARNGEDFRDLMKTYSEDGGSAESGTSYNATPNSQLVPPFKALALRLEPGETGIVESGYGWHVMQRIE